MAPTLTKALHSLEVNGFLQDVNAAIKNFEEWAKPVVPPFDIKTFAMKPKAHKIAKGVVLAITPFNYPLWLVTAPLVSSASLFVWMFARVKGF